MTAVMNAVRARQARCAALGFWPGPIDGIDGARTRAAFAEATVAQRAKRLPFQHPTDITRNHWHWTGGGHEPNATDMKAYHALISGDGKSRWPVDPTASRSHMLNANGGAIGLVLTGIIAWAASKAPQKWGVEIEARHREALVPRCAAVLERAPLARVGPIAPHLQTLLLSRDRCVKARPAGQRYISAPGS